MEFYVYLNGVKRGPFAEAQVHEFLAAGLLLPSDLVSDRGGADWTPVANHSRFVSPPPAEIVTPAPLVERLTPPPAARADQPSLARESLGPYARSTLAQDETPFFKTSLHWIIFVRFAFLTLIVFLFLALPFAIGVQALTASELGWFVLPLPAFIMIPPTLAFVSSELVITDRRVLIKTGIVRRRTLEMFISKVESIAVDQGFLGRLLDYGSVVIRGTGGMEEPFETIAHPIQLRNAVQRLQHGAVSA